MRDAGRRAGEIDDDIGAGERGSRGDRTPFEPVPARSPLSWPMASHPAGRCGGKLEPRRGVDLTDQHAAHAPGGPGMPILIVWDVMALSSLPVAARLFSRRRLGKI